MHELAVPDSRAQTPRSVTFPAYTVAEGEVFYLGDFRDQSLDSRAWDTLPQEGIVGEVTYIWFSQDFDRIGRRVE